jgi:hypothetical protein
VGRTAEDESAWAVYSRISKRAATTDRAGGVVLRSGDSTAPPCPAVRPGTASADRATQDVPVMESRRIGRHHHSGSGEAEDDQSDEKYPSNTLLHALPTSCL